MNGPLPANQDTALRAMLTQNSQFAAQKNYAARPRPDSPVAGWRIAPVVSSRTVEELPEVYP
jgi:hypothetical protein